MTIGSKLTDSKYKQKGKYEMNSPTAPPLSAKLMRGDVMAAACPSREILNHLTSRWGVLILIALLPGTQRFGQLRRLINGVSERMLAQTLQALEGDGMLQRHDYKTVPPHVEYSLTPLGREAAQKIRDLADWIEFNLPEILETRRATSAEAAR
jgi:DNA-binding HxlR family transcriptional regulator